MRIFDEILFREGTLLRIRGKRFLLAEPTIMLGYAQFLKNIEAGVLVDTSRKDSEVVKEYTCERIFDFKETIKELDTYDIPRGTEVFIDDVGFILSRHTVMLGDKTKQDQMTIWQPPITAV